MRLLAGKSSVTPNSKHLRSQQLSDMQLDLSQMSPEHTNYARRYSDVDLDVLFEDEEPSGHHWDGANTPKAIPHRRKEAAGKWTPKGRQKSAPNSRAWATPKTTTTSQIKRSGPIGGPLLGLNPSSDQLQVRRGSFGAWGMPATPPPAFMTPNTEFNRAQKALATAAAASGGGGALMTPTPVKASPALAMFTTPNRTYMQQEREQQRLPTVFMTPNTAYMQTHQQHQEQHQRPSIYGGGCTKHEQSGHANRLQISPPMRTAGLERWQRSGADAPATAIPSMQSQYEDYV
jgi:hypothetical protein